MRSTADGGYNSLVDVAKLIIETESSSYRTASIELANTWSIELKSLQLISPTTSIYKLQRQLIQMFIDESMAY